MKANWVHAALVAAFVIVMLVLFGFVLSIVYKISESGHPDDAVPPSTPEEIAKAREAWDAMYGPTGVEYVHTPQEIAAFECNRAVIHNHSWVGGEIIEVANMPSERDFFMREWYCQFCGVHCKGETLDYASKSLFFPWSV